MSQVLDFMV